jgi:hypothetical protein
MRSDWLAPSASALVVGAMALVLGYLLNPLTQEAGDLSDAVLVAEQAAGRWLGMAALLFFASVCLTLGLPALMSLFERRGRRLGVVAVGVFAVGTIGLSAYGMLLVFLRAAIMNDLIRLDRLERVTDDTGLLVFLGLWVGCFYLGVLLLGIALLVARTTPRWVPALLLAYVASQFIGDVLGDLGTVLQFFVLAIAFTGAAVAAAERSIRGERVLSPVLR